MLLAFWAPAIAFPRNRSVSRQNARVDSARRMLNIIRIAFLIAIVLYFQLSRSLPSHTKPNPVLLYALAAFACGEVLTIFILRWILVSRSEQLLAENPGDQKALARWKIGYLGMYAVALSVAIYGLLLHFLGFELLHVVPFFAGGALFILILPPRPIPARL